MSTSDYGFKISLPGFDVKTATPEQCAVHSSFTNFKAKAGQDDPHWATLDVDFTATVTQNVTHTVYSFTHGYTYIPAALAMIDFTTNASAKVYGIGYAAVGANLLIEAYTTSTQFIVTVYDNANFTGANARLLVSYYIFADPGA